MRVKDQRLLMSEELGAAQGAAMSPSAAVTLLESTCSALEQEILREIPGFLERSLGEVSGVSVRVTTSPGLSRVSASLVSRELVFGRRDRILATVRADREEDESVDSVVIRLVGMVIAEAVKLESR